MTKQINMTAAEIELCFSEGYPLSQVKDRVCYGGDTLERIDFQLDVGAMLWQLSHGALGA